jgi:hypothetical protein
MSEIVFRTAPAIPEPSEVTATAPEPEPEVWGTNEDLDVGEPIEDYENAILRAMHIDDDTGNLSQEDKGYLKDVSQYILGIVKERGIAVTQRAFDRVLRDVRIEMGIDPEAEPSSVLNRIGGMVSAWRDISFIKDPKERRSLFMKLAKMSSSSEMNNLILKEMDHRKVYSGNKY